MLRTALLAAVMTAFAVPAHAQTCTRDNLKTFVANYFKAVETHDLSALPTAPNLRITENGVETKPGEGFVKTGGKATVLRSLIDTERCGTLTQALVDETINGTTQPTIFAVRLKVTAGKVSEIEALMARKAGMAAGGLNFYDPAALLATKDQDWTTPLPKDKRLTRTYMNEQANKYFSGLAADPQDLPNFATPCHRWEGGVQTTVKNPSCSPKGLVLTHTHRRFPVTDTEVGITAGFINFGQNLPDVHMFKFNDEGKVVWIQAVFGGRVDATTQIWPDEK